ncbi:MAG: hypothetical protein LBC29_06215 [Propionibacteriaceae bacterium]|nr:hypothetical protein [Propionibacteriaceae bacterium]
MTLYDTIFTRRSVRQYDVAPLSETMLEQIRQHLAGLVQLPGQAARFEVVGRDKLKGGFAPYAILAYAAESEAACINIGYTLQGVDLWLQDQGLGSVWCGMATPLEKRADYRILLGFGPTNVPPRSSETDFKRKKITEISNADNPVARAARLAPSAVNLQPWLLTFSEGRIAVQVNVRGFGRVIPGKMWLFDIGIVTKYIELALAQEGNAVKDLVISGTGKDIAIAINY